MPSSKTFPSFDHYQSVLQHPDKCFSLPDLQNGTLETDLWGLPRVRSGGFALTYRVSNHSKSFAVRCFYKNVTDRYIRYQAIQSSIARLANKFLVPVHYAGKGIKVGKVWYPITIMPWVEGETLENFIFTHLDDVESIKHITLQFVEMIAQLEQGHFAHGDLSHENILVSNNQLILVDYDGFYVPSMHGKNSCELGHANFQHPARTYTFFSEKLDRFSAIVIFLALKAIAINPSLWSKYEKSGDGVLFRKTDFEKPYESALLQEIETYSSLRKFVYYFRKICLSGVNNIPSLHDFIQHKMPDFPRDEIYVPKRADQSTVFALDAAKKYLFSNQLGKIIKVVGQIKDMHHGKTKDGHPSIFLNFGNWRAKGFTVVLWDKGYDHFSPMINSGIITDDSWVMVTGILTAYQSRPQIGIDSPFGLEILPSMEIAYTRMGQPSPKIDHILENQTLTQITEKTVDVIPKLMITPKSYNKKKLDEYDNIISKRISQLYSSSGIEEIDPQKGPQ
jgi:serine/threonine protein kinase